MALEQSFETSDPLFEENVARQAFLLRAEAKQKQAFDRRGMINGRRANRTAFFLSDKRFCVSTGKRETERHYRQSAASAGATTTAGGFGRLTINLQCSHSWKAWLVRININRINVILISSLENIIIDNLRNNHGGNDIALWPGGLSMADGAARGEAVTRIKS